MERGNGWLPISRSRVRRPHHRERFGLRQAWAGGFGRQLREGRLCCLVCLRRLGNGDLGRARGSGGGGVLHLAIAGGLGIARGHTSGCLGGPAAGGCPSGYGLGRLRRGPASTAFVRGNTQAHLLFPGGGSVGLAYNGCAQGSRFPSCAPSRPLIRSPKRLSRSSMPRKSGTLGRCFQKRREVAEEKTDAAPFALSGRGTRAR